MNQEDVLRVLRCNGPMDVIWLTRALGLVSADERLTNRSMPVQKARKHVYKLMKYGLVRRVGIDPLNGLMLYEAVKEDERGRREDERGRREDERGRRVQSEDMAHGRRLLQ